MIYIALQYLNTISQGQIDADSCVRTVCKLYGLSPFLAYNEGYNDGQPTIGTSRIDAGRIKEARTLLGTMRGEPRQKLLLELGTYFIFKPGTVKSDLVQASMFVREAVHRSGTMPLIWKVESRSLYGHYLHQTGHIDECRKEFDSIIKMCEEAEDWPMLARALLDAGKLVRYGDPARLNYFQRALSLFQMLMTGSPGSLPGKAKLPTPSRIPTDVWKVSYQKQTRPLSTYSLHGEVTLL